ncbi:hypothetical protein HU200_061639 [Digitaria exilis]|uniref:Wall-associated receptor kinase galacturonan-binding domain-containing protein n=1 Tax=Digitaria exilis TaxID=1010633 RepID=A0A835A7H4_9POAL|nr:hypothetical protein HU200_061639 [Digitaria exilis]
MPLCLSHMRELRATTVTWKLLLLLLAATASVVALASPSQLPAVGLKANCTTTCGDVVVPYPFGITDGCYLLGYNLTCDTSYTPPRLFLGNGVLQVVFISLENATVRVLGPNIPIPEALHNENVANSTWGGHQWGLNILGPYVLSEEYNELVVVGCELWTELMITDTQNRDHVMSTCWSFCGARSVLDKECQASAKKKQSRRCQKCSGFRCCQVPVPFGMASYDVRVRSLSWSGYAENMTTSVFISEEGWFKLPYNYSDRPSSGIPTILAWAIVSDILRSARIPICAMALARICLESIYVNVHEEATEIHIFQMGA